MTEFERGRAAGLAEAVKVFKAWSGMETLDQMRWVYPVDPGGTMTKELGRLQKYIASIRALAASPSDHVLVPRNKTLAAEWLKLHWNTFCDADEIPVGRDRFLNELEEAGLIELREVVDEDLEDAFAFERGIEKGGNIWVLTENGHALIAQSKATKEPEA